MHWKGKQRTAMHRNNPNFTSGLQRLHNVSIVVHLFFHSKEICHKNASHIVHQAKH